ncbi:TetR/AcrR family transcriptional regulator [Streptomyces globosus]|uniref:TetR/AcrR family transcriptional regulator n=1 Tax=Streptomyces globosus TaxID=68209 RepID=A0A344U1Z6_9ACTN|nr:TetR/AcrR family transcriptional regulator [Streptomyces globosus]AXE24917.1 TetR/AcrR family transcriptional regulator [Streptomyces globosus]
MAPRRVDRAARREEILAAAVRVFARRGFAASRIEDVAAEAGIGKGSVYLYFSDRDELLEAAFAALAARSAALIEEALAGTGDPAERLEHLVRSVVAVLLGERDLARVLLDVWSVGRGGRPPVDMAGFYREYRGAIAMLLADAADSGAGPTVEPVAHAAVLVGAIEGCVLQWLFDSSLDLAGLVDPLLQLLIPARAKGRNP